jgi:xylitol oxidase
MQGADLAASTVGLGALGIVTELTLELVPSYQIQQFVYAGLARAELVAHVAEVMAAASSVRIFTTWTDASQIWLKRLDSEAAPPLRWLGAELATTQQTIGAEADPRSGTPQLGVPGPWYQRLPHFRLEFSPSWGEEIQSEFFVSRAAAAEAIDAVFELREVLAPVLFISEIRTVARDDLWLSPASGHDVLALHFTWVRDAERVVPVVAELQRRLAPYAARPHWGKLFVADRALMGECYPRLADFAVQARGLDPAGVFRNAFLDEFLGPVSG